MTVQERIKQALCHLAGVCNYATSEDGIGFNKMDTSFGHDLAEQSYPLTERQQKAALKMLVKYNGQLQNANISLPSMSELESELAVRAEVQAKQPIKPKESVKLDGECLIISFDYDPALVDAVKKIQGRRYNPNGRYWTVPVQQLEAVKSAFPDAQYDTRIEQAEREKAEQAEREKAERERKTKMLLDRLGDLTKPLSNGQTLYAHQQEAVKRMVSQDRVILADDMGLGKTKTALVAAKAYELPVFVIAPVSLHINWLREAEQVDVAIEVYSWSKIPQSPNTAFVLIADEAHYAQAGAKSKRGAAFLELADSAEACFCLTGTPIKNGRPVNLFPLLQATRHELARTKSYYERRFCDAKSTRWSRWDTTGATNLHELHERTQDVIIRRMKKDCLDLPQKVRVLRKAELSAKARKQYDETYNVIRAEYKRRLIDGEIKDGGEALVMLNHLRHAGSVAKIESAIELANEVLEQGQQVVLFTEFAETAKQIASAFSRSVLLTGDTKQADRQALVDRFQSGQANVWVSTIKAGGVGLTLTAASTVILVDRPWTPGDAVQAEDRCHRIGANGTVTAIWLQANGIDEAIDMLLTKKHERIELVLQGRRKTLRGIGSTKDVAREVASALLS